MAVVPDIDAALRRTVTRYRTGRRFARHFVAAKIRIDPVHRTLLELGAVEKFGPVVDAGCGKGQIALALLEAGLAKHVLGLDWAPASLADAARAAGGLSFVAEARDLAADPTLPRCDTVLLIDILYTLGTAAAYRLLDAAMAAANHRIVLRTLDANAGWRGRFAVELEQVGRRAWPHSGAFVEPLRLDDLCAALEAGGFTTKATPCWGRTPFANVLVIATRQSRSNGPRVGVVQV